MESSRQEYNEEEALCSPLSERNDEPMKEQDDDSVPELSDDVEMDLTTTPEDETNATQQQQAATFGGLVNLGNTCYLNSAFQMLASLDVLRLDESAPEEESELRKQFLGVLERVQRGETVNPTEFKKAIDARSPLFVGYRQQDSHEFLTTLLDLLDADYKQKTNEGDDKEDMETSQENESEELKDAADADDDENNEEQREGPASDVGESAQEMPSSQSFATLLPSRSLSELQNDDICQLLHGGSSSSSSEEPKQGATVLPQCKLIGGRAAVPLTGVTRLTSVHAVQDELAAAVPDSVQQNDQDQPAQEDAGPTPIEEYFTTHVRAQLKCDSCKYTRSHIETYQHLSLDIGSESGSVEEGLRKFFAPENREIKCEKCFCETATQTLEIYKLPRALLVHCKRFIVDVSPDYSSITYRKNQSPFHFGDVLSASSDGILGEFLADDVDIPPRDEGRWSLRHVDDEDDEMGDSDVDDEMGDSERSYRIRSVVNHIGSSASCGHYTCDASRLYPNGERQWTRFNDSWVSQVSTDDAMGASAQKTAYMVMYELE